MNEVTIAIKPLEHGNGLDIPSYATKSSAGLDLVAAVNEDVNLASGERALVPAGFNMALPEGYEAQIRPRSGLALKHGITLMNSPGTIDADYRGEVKIILVNLGQEEFVVSRGMRIAQMVIAPVTRVNLQEVANLDETDRGECGFGSTGTYC